MWSIKFIARDLIKARYQRTEKAKNMWLQHEEIAVKKNANKITINFQNQIRNYERSINHFQEWFHIVIHTYNIQISMRVLQVFIYGKQKKKKLEKKTLNLMNEQGKKKTNF